uniref:Glycosyltransferase family 92 protein n=1 Tax=Panagrellus redivivus TaxID=6233 RepID=A0A7E4VR15_PANRE
MNLSKLTWGSPTSLMYHFYTSTPNLKAISTYFPNLTNLTVTTHSLPHTWTADLLGLRQLTHLVLSVSIIDYIIECDDLIAFLKAHQPGFQILLYTNGDVNLLQSLKNGLSQRLDHLSRAEFNKKYGSQKKTSYIVIDDVTFYLP